MLDPGPKEQRQEVPVGAAKNLGVGGRADADPHDGEFGVFTAPRMQISSSAALLAL